MVRVNSQLQQRTMKDAYGHEVAACTETATGHRRIQQHVHSDDNDPEGG
jgi:hypothetical protein